MDFMGVGLPELLVILILTLIVVGPQRLPQVAGQLARYMREFRRYSARLAREFADVMEDFEREYGDVKKEWKEVQTGLQEDARAVEGQLKGVAEDAEKGLRIEAPKPSTSAASSSESPGGEKPAQSTTGAPPQSEA
jgi:Sec-independent protein translocase protein TatA